MHRCIAIASWTRSGFKEATTKSKEPFYYALDGIGHNLIYALFIGFLLIFYTDVFGLSPSFTAILFLLARIFDTVNDPMMGHLADRTVSKFGCYQVRLFRLKVLRTMLWDKGPM